MFFDRFYPTEYYASAYIIDYDRLYKEGYRCTMGGLKVVEVNVHVQGVNINTSNNGEESKNIEQ